MAVFTTEDYNAFKFTAYNRNIDENHVEKLKASIQKRDMTSSMPILVSDKMEILDGQHRFLALKSLKKPITYIKVFKHEARDVLTLNTNQKNWTIYNFFKFYAANGNRMYQSALNFMELHDIGIHDFILFAGYKKHQPIKDGLFTFYADEIHNILDKYRVVCDTIKRQLKCNERSFLKSRFFVRALVVFVSDDRVDFNDFIENLKRNSYELSSKSSPKEYMRMFERIYNFKRRKDTRVVINDEKID